MLPSRKRTRARITGPESEAAASPARQNRTRYPQSAITAPGQHHNQGESEGSQRPKPLHGTLDADMTTNVPPPFRKRSDLGFRPCSRATTARRSLRGERRPLSSAVGVMCTRRGIAPPGRGVLLQPGCLAPEITEGLADRLPRLGCPALLRLVRPANEFSLRRVCRRA